MIRTIEYGRHTSRFRGRGVEERATVDGHQSPRSVPQKVGRLGKEVGAARACASVLFHRISKEMIIARSCFGFPEAR